MTRRQIASLLFAAGAGVCALAASSCGDKPSTGGNGDGSAPGQLHAYYLPRGDQCTVLVDFAARRSDVDRLSGDERAAYLARAMIGEFRRAGRAESKGAGKIQMIAVYIEGKDNYNRPDFSKRTNLLKLSGTAEQFSSLSDEDAGNWERVKSVLKVESE